MILPMLLCLLCLTCKLFISSAFFTENFIQYSEKMFVITRNNALCIQMALQQFVTCKDFNLLITNSDTDIREIFETLSTTHKIGMINTLFVKQHTFTHHYRYVIIATNVTQLYDIFTREQTYDATEYIFITNFGGPDLATLANYLWVRKYMWVGFLEVKSANDLVMYRYDESTSGQYRTKLRAIDRCGETLLDDERRKNIKPLRQMICPPGGCVLNFLRVNDGLNKKGILFLSKLWRVYTADLPWHILHLNESRASTYKGVGANMLYNFADMYNVTVNLSNVDEENTWKEGISNMTIGLVDVIYGTNTPSAEQLQYVTTANWMRIHESYFIGKSIPKLIHFTNVFLPLNNKVWFCVVAAFLLHVCFVAIVQKYHRMGLIREDMEYIDSIKLLIGQDANIPQKTALRCVTAIWLIGSFLLTAIYTCNFQSIHMLDVDEQNIKSLKDLLKSKHDLGGPRHYVDIIRHRDDTISKEMTKRFQRMDGTKIVQALMDRKNYMFIALNDFNIQLLVSYNHNLHTFYVIMEPLFSYPVFFYMKPGHPYKEFIKNAVLRQKSAGFTFNQISMTNAQKDLFNKVSKPLSVEHILIPVLIFCFGCCYAAISLIIELLLTRYIKTLNKNLNE